MVHSGIDPLRSGEPRAPAQGEESTQWIVDIPPEMGTGSLAAPGSRATADPGGAPGSGSGSGSGSWSDSAGVGLHPVFILPTAEELQHMLEGTHEVECFLDHGGMGAVYRGVQLPLRRPVAIKIVARGIGSDMAFEERFTREAYAMASLIHPNVVQVHDFGCAGQHFLFISMEYMEGGDLSRALKAGYVSTEVALHLLPQICDGLQAAHEKGIIHRDIKPANIFLTQDGRAKVADFGLAKRFDTFATRVTKSGLGLGTPDYAAPEQYDDVPDIDHRADIFSLGVMTYQLLTGRIPRGAWCAPSTLAGTDPRLDDVVLRAMNYNRELRYQSVAEMKEDIRKVISTPCSRSRTVARPRALPGNVLPFPSGAGEASAATSVIRVAEPVLDDDEPAQAPAVPTVAVRVQSSRSPVTPSTPGVRRPSRPLYHAPHGPGAGMTAPTGNTARMERKRIASMRVAACVIAAFVIGAAGTLAMLAPGQKERRVDLINGVVVAGAPIMGEWVKGDEGLRCLPPGRPGTPAGLRPQVYDFGFTPPAEYDFEIEFTRRAGSVLQILTAGDKVFMHELRQPRKDGRPVRSGLHGLDGELLDDALDGYALISAPPADDTRHTLTVQVRNTGVRSLLDGEQILHWAGDTSRLHLPLPRRAPERSGHLGVAAREGDITFHRATVREISPAPESTRKASDSALATAR